MKNISNLNINEVGVVKKVTASGEFRRRIVDMGVIPSAKIKMIKSAPFGDPIQIKIHGYNLSIRKSEAEKIEIFENNYEFKKYINNEIYSKSFFSGNDSFPVLNLYTSEKVTENSNYKIALIGNPNCGKTTLFNTLTGEYQYVGNWPGVTVERKEGQIKNTNKNITLVDLPGVYSLSPYSPEEIVTRDYVLNETPDIIINIVDATNLERNLYLTTQLLELNFKVIVALNMIDILNKKGIKIDCGTLEHELGCTVVPISAGNNYGIDKLLKVISQKIILKNDFRKTGKFYSSPLESAVESIEKIIENKNIYRKNERFIAVKIFENDSLILKNLHLDNNKIESINGIIKNISNFYDESGDIIIAKERYKYIYNVCSKVNKNTIVDKLSFSDKLDKILTGKYTAVPCFIALIFMVFYLTFGPFGICLKGIFERLINDNMYNLVQNILVYTGASDWSKSLILDAMIGAVGAVISFLPQVVLLFILLSLLEDCGYMARAAFIMDSPLRKIGLSGKSFVPLIMGFGCSVPAVLGTKILENKKDKNLTVFLIPFMSCSAKTPIYLLFTSTFFPQCQAFVMFLLYLTGILVAVLTSYIFNGSNLFKGSESPFIMEMPEYKIPSVKNIRLNVWDKTKDFIERAGTVILIATVVIWFLQSFTFDFHLVTDKSKSILAIVGSSLAPMFKLCGFGNWQSAVALFTGIIAKESIVSTLTVLYDAGNVEELSKILPNIFNNLSAISFLVFSLLYTPCVAAISAIHKEFENTKYTIVFVVYQLFIAYVLSALSFQILKLIF